MPDLLVRGVDDAIIRALKERAGAHGRSAEAEHRAILKAALARPHRRTLTEVLASMPDVGLDSDFERVDATELSPHVFD
jgi:plasmid stability protein